MVKYAEDMEEHDEGNLGFKSMFSRNQSSSSLFIKYPRTFSFACNRVLSDDIYDPYDVFESWANWDSMRDLTNDHRSQLTANGKRFNTMFTWMECFYVECLAKLKVRVP